MDIKPLLIGIVKAYQWCMAPLVGGCCRFYPSCSNYAVEALCKHGCLKGGWLALKRIMKCGPWNKGGVDLP